MTLEADYAVRIVEHLVLAGRKCDAASIAEATQVPLRFALKILRKLVQSGLVTSYKGARGGYQLARPASEITLRQEIPPIWPPYLIGEKEMKAVTFPSLPKKLRISYRKI